MVNATSLIGASVLKGLYNIVKKPFFFGETEWDFYFPITSRCPLFLVYGRSRMFTVRKVVGEVCKELVTVKCVK